MFNGNVHEALVRAFRDIGDHPEFHVAYPAAALGMSLLLTSRWTDSTFSRRLDTTRFSGRGQKSKRNIRHPGPDDRGAPRNVEGKPNLLCFALSSSPPKMPTFGTRLIPHSASCPVMLAYRVA